MSSAAPPRSARWSVLEARHVGFGASGRNGGWVIGVVSGSAAAWRRRAGPEAPRRMLEAIHATVDEIGQVVEREAIECDWHPGGTLTVAQSATQLGRLEAQLAEQREWAGEASALQLLTAEEARARVRVDGVIGALYRPVLRADPAGQARLSAWPPPPSGPAWRSTRPVRRSTWWRDWPRTPEGFVSARQVVDRLRGLHGQPAGPPPLAAAPEQLDARHRAPG